MRDYRLVLVLKSDLKKEAKDKLLADVQSWVGKVEGVKVDSVGDKKLAYPVKKARTGDFVVMHFKAETIPTDVDMKMRLQDPVLRYLLVRE